MLRGQHYEACRRRFETHLSSETATNYPIFFHSNILRIYQISQYVIFLKYLVNYIVATIWPHLLFFDKIPS